MGGLCHWTLLTWKLLQTQRLPTVIHIWAVYPPCGHPQTLSHDVTMSTLWSYAGASHAALQSHVSTGTDANVVHTCLKISSWAADSWFSTYRCMYTCIPKMKSATYMYWLLRADNCKYAQGWLCGKIMLLRIVFTYALRWEDSVLAPEQYSAFLEFCYYLRIYYRPKDSQLRAMACMTSVKRNNCQSFI